MTDIEIDPRIERIIWKGLGLKNVRQLAEETGLQPDQIYALKRELYESVDVLTTQQKKHRLMVTLEEIAQQTQKDYADAPFEFKSGLANSAISSMKTMMVELNRVSKQDQGAIEQLNQLRVREVLRLVDTTVARTLEEIASRYDLEEADLQAIFQSHLKPAASELESNESA